MAIIEWITLKGSLRYARSTENCITTEGEYLERIEFI